MRGYRCIRLGLAAATIICADMPPGMATAHAVSRTACDGVDSQLTKVQARLLSQRVAQQFNDSGTTVSQSFRMNGWTLAIADFTKSDAGFVFYRGDPLRTPYVTVWSGAAMTTEEQEIRHWTLKNAPGIPPTLAACFAWYVTNSGNW